MKPSPKKRTSPHPAEQPAEQQDDVATPEQTGGMSAILRAIADAPLDSPAEPKIVLEGIGASEHQPPIEVPVMPPPSHTPATRRRPPPASTGAYKLPRGAAIALRQSGGLRFTSMEVVVYSSGEYLVRRTAPAPRKTQKGQLGTEQLAALREALAASGLETLETGGRHNPDSYAYELAARIGRRAYVVELFDGSMPEEAEPLLRQLSALLTIDD